MNNKNKLTFGEYARIKKKFLPDDFPFDAETADDIFEWGTFHDFPETQEICYLWNNYADEMELPRTERLSIQRV